MLPPDAFNRTTFSDSKKVANVQFMGPMEDGLREKIVELWQETKAYFQN